MKRNTTLFLFELVMAVLLVLVHMSVKDDYYVLVRALGRSTVLFFFMVSGFFFYKKHQNDSLEDMYLDVLKRVARLLLFAGIVLTLTLLFDFGVKMKFDTSLVEPYLKEHFNSENVFRFFVFNNVTIAGHLWFIFALIYAYLLLPLFIKPFKITKGHPFFIGAVATLTLIYAYTYFKYQTNYIDERSIFFNLIFTRNWFFQAIPCLLIGSYLSIHEEVVVQKISSIKKWIIILILVAFQALIIGEAALLLVYDQVLLEFYLFGIPLCMGLIAFSLACPNNKAGEFLLKHIGSKCPTIIYLFHLLFISIFTMFFSEVMGIEKYMFFPILLCTLVSVISISFIVNLVNQKRSKVE